MGLWLGLGLGFWVGLELRLGLGLGLGLGAPPAPLAASGGGCLKHLGQSVWVLPVAVLVTESTWVGVITR